MPIPGFGSSGEARAFELATHPFSFGTLFQPERSAFAGIAHPLITAYVQAAASYATQENAS